MKKPILTASLVLATVIVLIFTCTPFTFGNAFIWFWRKSVEDFTLRQYVTMLLPVILAVPALFIICNHFAKPKKQQHQQECFDHALYEDYGDAPGTRGKCPVYSRLSFFLVLLIASIAFQVLLAQCAPNGVVRQQLATFSESSNGALYPSVVPPAQVCPNTCTETEIRAPSNNARHTADTWSVGRKAFSKIMFHICSWAGGIYLKYVDCYDADNMIPIMFVTQNPDLTDANLLAPLCFLATSFLAIALCSFLLWKAALRLYARTTGVTDCSAMNALQTALVLSLPATLFAGRIEAVHFCLAAVVTYFIVYAFRANSGFCKAGYCALAGLLNAVAISYDIVFLLFIPFIAALLFCRKDWRKGRIPMILYCTGALVFFIAVWAYGNVNLFTETIAQFSFAHQGGLYPKSVKFLFLQIPYNILSIMVFATPMACLTAFSSRHLFVKKNAKLSTHGNLFAWATAALLFVAVVIPFVFGVSGAATLAVIPVVLVLSVKNVFETGENIPVTPLKTALFAQVLLIACIRIFFQIPFVLW